MPPAHISNPGAAIVLSGPSGVGKTTVYRRFLDTHPDVHFSVSCTTRPPRDDEVPGTSYHFLTVAEFRARIEAGDFLEHATVHGNLYGTLRSEVEAHVLHGRDVLLDIDVQGARLVRRAVTGTPLEAHALFVFCGPPAFSVLEERLRSRKTESEESILERIRNARVELEAWREYEYLIINDTVPEAVSDLAAVIRAFSCRTSRFTKDVWNDG